MENTGDAVHDGVLAGVVEEDEQALPYKLPQLCNHSHQQHRSLSAPSHLAGSATKVKILARACGVPVGRRSGGRLATTLVVTINVIIFFLFFLFFFLRRLLFS